MGRKHNRSRRNTKKNTRQRRMNVIGKNTTGWARRKMQERENHKKNIVAAQNKKNQKNQKKRK